MACLPYLSPTCSYQLCVDIDGALYILSTPDRGRSLASGRREPQSETRVAGGSSRTGITEQTLALHALALCFADAASREHSYPCTLVALCVFAGPPRRLGLALCVRS